MALPHFEVGRFDMAGEECGVIQQLCESICGKLLAKRGMLPRIRGQFECQRQVVIARVCDQFGEPDCGEQARAHPPGKGAAASGKCR